MSFKKLVLAGAITALLGAAFVQPAVAQQVTSTISGTVLDPQGNPVVNADVTVTDTRTNRRITTVTTSSGQFTARGLEVGGPYSVQVDSDEYVDERVDDVFITLSDTATLTFGLENESADLGALQVVGIADVGGYQRALGPGSSYDLQDIKDLPSISRDIRDVFRVDPRVTIDPANQDGAVSCAGANSRFNSFTVDGVRQDDTFGLNVAFPGQAQPFPLDAINQVSVEFAPFDVEYGNFSGCNINVVTKSGTNEFTGGVFEYYRGDALASNQSGDFESHNFGAFIGGPILKDRLFFFVSYEETIGDQAVDDGPAGSGLPNVVDGISAGQIDQIRNILLNTYNYDPGVLPLGSATDDNRRILVRIDANLTDDHRLAFNYQRTREDFTTQVDNNASFGDLAFSSHFYNSGNNIDAYSLRLFSNWTDQLSTEVRLSRFDNEDTQDPLLGLGFAEIEVDLDDGSVFAGPDFFRQTNDLRSQTDQAKFKADYKVANHEVTFGYELDSFDVFNLFLPATSGAYVFDSIEGLAAQDPTEFEFNGVVTGNINDAAAEFKRDIHTFYLQDEWNPVGGLTLLAGLRYDYYKSNDRPISNAFFQQRYGFDNAEQVFDGLKALQPRIGFSYELPVNSWGFTTLRGGVGVFSGGDPSVIFSGSFSNVGVITDNVQLDDDNSDLLGPGSANGSSVPQFAVDQLVAGDGQVAAIDPELDLPTVFRANFGITHSFLNDFTVTFDYIYSDAENPYLFQGLNLAQVDIAPDGRPVYREVDFLDPDCASNPGDASICDARFTDDILLTNGGGGRTHNLSISLSKAWYDIGGTGVDFETTVGYSYTDSEDIHPVTSSVPTSNFGNVSLADFNNPVVATANDEIPHNAIFRGTLRKAFFGDYETTLNLFATIRSGRPFSYNFDTGNSSNNLFGDSREREDRSLLYVPLENDPLVVYADDFDLAGFNAFLAESGLDQFRGQIAPRNAFNSSTFTDLDIRFTQELPGFFNDDRITLFFDIENFLNLIDSDANDLRQIGFEFNNPIVDASINEDGQFSFNNFDTPSTERLVTQASLWRIQIGARYDF